MNHRAVLRKAYDGVVRPRPPQCLTALHMGGEKTNGAAVTCLLEMKIRSLFFRSACDNVFFFVFKSRQSQLPLFPHYPEGDVHLRFGVLGSVLFCDEDGISE